jgi:hypothetical protein
MSQEVYLEKMWYRIKKMGSCMKRHLKKRK